MALTRRAWLGAGAALVCGHAVQAQAQAPEASKPWPEVLSELPLAKLAGAARLRFWGLDIYDAQLWVLPGFQAINFAQHPLALSLTYLRSLKGRLIAERSLKEMQAQTPLGSAEAAAWLAAMTALFPDVQAGDRLTGLHQPGTAAVFWLNGQRLGAVPQAPFSARFFGIWLAAGSSEPALRQQLLGRFSP